MSVVFDVCKTPEITAFFRSIPTDWFVDYDGDVEDPAGWFGIVDLSEDVDMSEMHPSIPGMSASVNVSEFADMRWMGGLPKGYYLVRIDSNGFVWAFFYGSDHNAASKEFDRISNEYADRYEEAE